MLTQYTRAPNVCPAADTFNLFLGNMVVAEADPVVVAAGIGVGVIQGAKGQGEYA